MNENNQSLQEIKQEVREGIAKAPKNLGDVVAQRVEGLVKEGRLTLPENYSVGNAISSAYLILQNVKDKSGNAVLKSCTKESIANSLLDMAIQGLNPSKKQGYFIAYGDQLTWFTSVFGKCACLKRCKGIDTEPVATLIHEGDDVELGFNELGDEVILNHKTSFANKDNALKGVYATVNVNGVKRSAVLTTKEVKEIWTKSGQKRDHQDFQGEFFKRTAINRLVKYILQSSNDDDLLAEDLIENEEQHYEFTNVENVEDLNTVADTEVKANANTGEVIDIEEAKEEVKVEEAPKEEVKKPARPF